MRWGVSGECGHELTGTMHFRRTTSWSDVRVSAATPPERWGLERPTGSLGKLGDPRLSSATGLRSVYAGLQTGNVNGVRGSNEPHDGCMCPTSEKRPARDLFVSSCIMSFKMPRRTPAPLETLLRRPHLHSHHPWTHTLRLRNNQGWTKSWLLPATEGNES